MTIVSPDELEKKLTPEEEEKYKELEEQINEDLPQASAYSCKDRLSCYNVDLHEIPSRRVLRKINEEAKKVGWDKVTLEDSSEGDYLKFWPKKELES